MENKPEKLVSKTGVRQVKFLMTDDEESTDQRSQETGRQSGMQQSQSHESSLKSIQKQQPQKLSIDQIKEKFEETKRNIDEKIENEFKVKEKKLSKTQ